MESTMLDSGGKPNQPPRRTIRLLLVTGLYPTPDRPTAGVFVARRAGWLRGSGVEVDVIAPTTYRGSMIRRYLRLAIRALAPSRRVDGVEAHVLLPTGLVGAIAARRRGVPVVVFAHGSDVAYTAWRHPLLTALGRFVATRADAVVANSQETAEFVRRLGGAPIVVSPGVDFTAFCPGPSERAALGLPEGRLALFVGNREPHKGADLFANGVLATSDWRGVMVGDGPSISEDPRIETRGSMPLLQLPRLMRSVDCVVMPSRREGLGLVAIEALACGTPVLSSGRGGLAEIVQQGANGIVMSELSAAAVADGLVRLEESDFDVQALRETVREHDQERTTAQLGALWRDVLAGGKGAPRRGR
jgi:teichuronic acid biosynthesis glycosyltransferase TuaC